MKKRSLEAQDCGGNPADSDLFWRLNGMEVAWSPVRNSYIPLELPLSKDVNKHIQILAAVLKNY